jgi:hypothetical protein
MYIWFLKKPNNIYIYYVTTIFKTKDDAILNIINYINENGNNIKCYTSILIIEINNKINLFTKELFIKYYKYFYLNEHIKEPILYPVKYIEPLHICFQYEKKYKKTSNLMKRFLNDINCPPTYSIYNCTIKKKEIDLLLLNNDYNIIEFEDLNGFICYFKNKQNEIILLNILDNYIESLEFIIKTIIKKHEFYFSNYQLCLLNKYFIQNFPVKNNEFKNYIQNWYQIITEIQLLFDTVPCNKEKIKILCDKFTKCSDKLLIPPILFNELERLCTKCNNLI